MSSIIVLIHGFRAFGTKHFIRHLRDAMLKAGKHISYFLKQKKDTPVTRDDLTFLVNLTL